MNITPDASKVKTPECVRAFGTIMAHTQCSGYVAPLVYGASQPCGCSCHEPDETRGTLALASRDYRRAVYYAEMSVHGAHVYAYRTQPGSPRPVLSYRQWTAALAGGETINGLHMCGAYAGAHRADHAGAEG